MKMKIASGRILRKPDKNVISSLEFAIKLELNS